MEGDDISLKSFFFVTLKDLHQFTHEHNHVNPGGHHSPVDLLVANHPAAPGSNSKQSIKFIQLQLLLYFNNKCEKDNDKQKEAEVGR